nr:MAG: putative RNA dependent RNA polymerase [Xisha Islands farmland mitovirus 2]
MNYTMKTKRQNLSVNKVWSKARLSLKRDTKVFPITPKVLNLKGARLSVPWKKIISLSMGRTTGLRNRLVIASRFIQLVLTLKKDHGADFTVKWLKACYVAIQKAQAGDNLTSLRALEPGLPLPRLVNGIPAFIGPKDRHYIKEGHVNVIRFWSSLFSIYRVLKCSYKLKVETITKPFTGDSAALQHIVEEAKRINFFKSLSGYHGWQKNLRLAPTTFIMGKSASPSNKVAWHGILTELWALLSRDGTVPPMVQNIESYMEVLKSHGHNTNPFMTKVNNGWELIGTLWEVYQKNISDLTPIRFERIFPVKQSSMGYWGQLSLKEEAAGKLRVFAMVDNLTQSILKPLHLALFDLLAKIPNDGTFDQDKSVERSRDKAIKAKCAFSFDLSAATDRLPAVLSAEILSKILQIPVGAAWLKLLVDRDYYFGSDKNTMKYVDNPGPVRYAVGQPMGAYSSWAMLAITHHWILQYCSFLLSRVHRYDGSDYVLEWNENYEILGDDLTIFDPALANCYLDVCKILGVEINLTKSISSPNKPVFEFAKRTYNGPNDVSPIPFKQLLNYSIADLIGWYLSYSKKGMITSVPVLLRLIHKFGENNKFDKFIVHPLLAILGVLASKEVIPHRWLVESLVDPKDEDFDFDESSLKIPLVSSIKVVMDGATKIREESKIESYPWSQREIREEFYDDYEDEFANVISNEALTLARKLELEFDDKLSDASNSLLLITDEERIWLKKEGVSTLALSYLEEILYNWDKGVDPVELVDAIETDPKVYYRRGLTIEHAQSILDVVEKLSNHFDLKPKAKTDERKFVPAKAVVALSRVVRGQTHKYWKYNRVID